MEKIKTMIKKLIAKLTGSLERGIVRDGSPFSEEAVERSNARERKSSATEQMQERLRNQIEQRRSSGDQDGWQEVEIPGEEKSDQ